VRRTGVRILGLLILLAAAPAAADSPHHYLAEDRDVIEWRDDRALFEWSTWIRLGFGVERTASETAARATQPTPAYDQHTRWDPALGVDVTLPLPTRKVRMGPWLELTRDGVFGGGELSIAGKDLDMFWYRGERVYTVRAGASTTHVTGAFAYGYRCPWKLWGPYNSATRYMIGVRLVASATRAVADPNDWSASLGIEFEPLGSLRYVGGIRSWY
jgi:hypothetical protein